MPHSFGWKKACESHERRQHGMGAAAIQCSRVNQRTCITVQIILYCRREPESGDDDDWRTLSLGWVSPPGLNYYTTVHYKLQSWYHDPPPVDRIFVEMVTV